MIYDDDLGFAHLGASALIVAGVGAAILAITGGAFGVDHFPDVPVGRWVQFLAQAVFRRLRPSGDALELFEFVVGKEFSLVGDGVAESRWAEIVALADEKSRFEVRVGVELGNCTKELSAYWKVLLLDLFLESDCVRGNDGGAFRLDRMDDPGN